MLFPITIDFIPLVKSDPEDPRIFVKAIFLKLYEQYNLSGEKIKAQKIKELAKTVSSRTEYGTKWMQYFEK